MSAENPKPCARCKKLESALKAIYTWAAFDLKGEYPDDPALTPEDVVALCEKALKRG